MGHHPQDVPLPVHDPGDGVEGAVGVGRVVPVLARAVGADVAEDHPLLLLQGFQGLGIAEIVAVHVGDGDAQHLALAVLRGEEGGGGLHPQVDVLA